MPIITIISYGSIICAKYLRIDKTLNNLDELVDYLNWTTLVQT
jgi:hypothetical protein